MMPYEALLATIWQHAPVDPNEFDDWPLGRTMRILWYIGTRATMEKELGK